MASAGVQAIDTHGWFANNPPDEAAPLVYLPIRVHRRSPAAAEPVRPTFHISDAYRTLLSEIGLTAAEQVFVDPRLRVWRDLPDRDNSTLDVTRAEDGRSVRLHVKRDKHRRREPMNLEARGIGLLESAGIPSAPLVASGAMPDGRTFVITENLDGYLSADRLIETGVPLPPVLRAMADVAARLHNGGLHHRDLYANHFYLRRNEGNGYDVRLIDTARVRRLPRLLRERWIVKDVAQLLFSVTPYIGSTGQADLIFDHYCQVTGRSRHTRFERRIYAKVAWIERHDRALREKKPKRNLRLADGN